jgi:hypothetical protein
MPRRSVIAVSDSPSERTSADTRRRVSSIVFTTQRKSLGDQVTSEGYGDNHEQGRKVYRERECKTLNDESQSLYRTSLTCAHVETLGSGLHYLSRGDDAVSRKVYISRSSIRSGMHIWSKQGRGLQPWFAKAFRPGQGPR